MKDISKRKWKNCVANSSGRKTWNNNCEAIFTIELTLFVKKKYLPKMNKNGYFHNTSRWNRRSSPFSQSNETSIYSESDSPFLFIKFSFVFMGFLLLVVIYNKRKRIVCLNFSAFQRNRKRNKWSFDRLEQLKCLLNGFIVCLCEIEMELYWNEMGKK